MVGKQEAMRLLSQNHLHSIPPSRGFMNAGRPTQREQGLEGTRSGDRQARGESWKSNCAPGLSADGSFPRPRESPRPSVPRMGCLCVSNSSDPEPRDASNSPQGCCSAQAPIFQESCKFSPKSECVVAGLADCTGGQGGGLRRFNPATALIQ